MKSPFKRAYHSYNHLRKQTLGRSLVLAGDEFDLGDAARGGRSGSRNRNIAHYHCPYCEMAAFANAPGVNRS
jgi:hypothetical protein